MPRVEGTVHTSPWCIIEVLRRVCQVTHLFTISIISSIIPGIFLPSKLVRIYLHNWLGLPLSEIFYSCLTLLSVGERHEYHWIHKKHCTLQCFGEYRSQNNRRNWYDGAHWEGSSYVIGKRDTQSHLEAKYLKGNDIRLYNGSKRQQTYTLLERHLSKEKVTERWLQRTIDPNDEHRVARSIKPVDESIYSKTLFVYLKPIDD
ncbi:hypothetical protein PCASD_20088 [Puccinia coronata f. sp. avenae]|uniref:Uncharacterized protein n=1 Tax=Puccinia coronata f. sp. avenae TaxID=200324 RepID=A0A2N5TQ80_9BASI|nr:hypothetical protein PCASD_20088 [Puccinia coronata f. sp. avenae]